MTTRANDTLQKQISRGEVYYANSLLLSLADADTIYAAVETSTNNCSLTLEVQTNAQLIVTVYEGLTSYSSGSTVDTYNMNREASHTLLTTIEDNVSTIVGGTVIFPPRVFLDGKAPENSPFNTESGMILAPSTKYGFKFTNDGTGNAYLGLNMFLRENA